MERYDHIENLNAMTRKKKVMDERKKREEMMEERATRLRAEQAQEEQRDRE